VDGVYVGPIADGDLADLVQQVRDGADPLPAKQLLKRASVDPGAVVSDLDRPAPGSDPLPPEPSAFGPPMGTPTPPEGPAAPIEQAPTQPDEGPSQKEGRP
jgi:NADH-quinone oxidoreductase subunit E